MKLLSPGKHHISLYEIAPFSYVDTSPGPELFFLPAPPAPPIGADPGRANRECRITCMRMLRTNQSKNSRSQQRCSHQCVAQCLFQLVL